MHFDRDRENDRLERFERDNAPVVAEIETMLREAGCPDSALDELVHDAAGNIDPERTDEASAWASENVNNQGFARQIAFVLQENGPAEGRVLIVETMREAMVADAIEKGAAPTP
jgi:hypothetical protein